MLLVAILVNTNMQNTWKMTETLAHLYSSESTPQELSNEYQHDRVKVTFKSVRPSSLDKSSLSIERIKGAS